MTTARLTLESSRYFISTQSTIAIENRDKQDDFPVHSHEFDELVIVFAGNGIHMWNGHESPITCGDLFYIHAEDKHGFRSVNALNLVNILYKPQQFALKSVIDRYIPAPNAPCSERHWQINLSFLAQIQQVIEQISPECQKADRSAIDLSETLFLQLAILLYRFRHQPDSATLSSAHQLDILFSYLHKSIDKPFSLPNFAKEYQISTSSLRRLFKARTGMTVNHYLQQLRLCQAASLLRETDLSISEIAARCGYDDSNYFSSVFHRHMRQTASQYRRCFQGDS